MSDTDKVAESRYASWQVTVPSFWNSIFIERFWTTVPERLKLILI